MRRILFTLTLIVVATVSLQAQSQDAKTSATQLVEDCSNFKLSVESSKQGPRISDLNPTFFFSSGECAGYMWAIMDFNPAIKWYCAPEGVTLGQLIKVFLKYMDEHPEQLHEDASLMLLRSLRKAFPCKEWKQ
jgi:hypothetical protein